MSRLISMTGLTLERSTKPCSMPDLLKSTTGVAGRSGMTPELSKRFRSALSSIGRARWRRARGCPARCRHRADARRPGIGVELDRRAAGVQHGVAVERLQLAGRRHLQPPVARVDGSGGGLNAEPGVALDGHVEAIVGPHHLAGLARKIALARGCKGDRRGRRMREQGLELDLLGAKTGGGGVGHVVGDRLQPLLQGQSAARERPTT